MKKILIGIFIIILTTLFTIVNLNNGSSKKISSMTFANLVALSGESNPVVKCGQWESEEKQESSTVYYQTYACLIPGNQDVTKCKTGKITYKKGLFGIHYDKNDSTKPYNCADLN
jgi:hypothetical protein